MQGQMKPPKGELTQEEWFKPQRKRASELAVISIISSIQRSTSSGSKSKAS